jgi:hypothetical protein
MRLTLCLNALKNWNAVNFVFKRSKEYQSVLRSQVLEIELPFDGKTYIDTIYETYGIDTEIGCEIQYLDKSDFTYATLYDGIIDLSEWSKFRDTTTVKVIDGTILSKFTTRDDIEIQLSRTTDLDGNAISTYDYLNSFSVDAVDIEQRAQWQDDANAIAINAVKSAPFTEYYGVTGDNYDFNVIGADATLPAVSLITAAGVVYTNNSGGNQKISYQIITAVQGNIAVVASNAWSWRFRAFVGINTGGGWEAANTRIDESASGSANDSRGISDTYDSGEIIITLAAGETLEIYHQWEGVATGGDTITPNFDIEPTYVQVSEIIDGEPLTSIDMPLTHELAAMLLEIMTGQSDPLNSAILGRTDSEPRTYGSDGDFSLNGCASGFMLRGFPFTNQPFTTTFKKFFQTIQAIANVGLWWDESNDEFQIKLTEDYYRVDSIIQLGEVTDFETSVAGDEYFNKILAGYVKDVDYEDINGQQVANVKAEFANDGQRIQNIKNLQSDYRGDDYGIELSRKEDYSDTAGEDTKYDNDNFILMGQRSGGNYRTLQGTQGFTSVSGVYSPTTRLNLDITPKRNLLRNSNRASIPAFISNSDLLFTRSQFNLPLSTQKSGEPSAIVETEDIDFSDLDEPLYYPEIYNFTAVLSYENVLQLVSDPHGYVEFDLEVSSEPFNRRGNWTLLKRNPNRT